MNEDREIVIFLWKICIFFNEKFVLLQGKTLRGNSHILRHIEKSILVYSF